jgi:cytochrome c
MTPMNLPPLRRALRILATLGLAGGAWLAHGQTVDLAAAEALAKKSNCTKCHSVDKKKDGPSFKETAAKYRGQSDAEAKLSKHITSGPKIKIDGVEEEHQMVKTKDPAEIKNLVRYVLSR